MPKVVDLNAGLGARAIAFKNAGFEVVQVNEVEKRCIPFLEMLFKEERTINRDLFEIIPENVADADVILAKFIGTPFSSVGRGERKPNLDNIIQNLILQKNPRAFLIELPANALSLHNRNELEKYFEKFEENGFSIAHNVFDERIYSGYPYDGRQAYLVGTKGNVKIDLGINPEPNKSIIYDNVTSDSKYRNNIIKLPNNFRAGKGEWYHVRHVKNLLSQFTVQATDCISFRGFSETFVADEKGLRRFTHDEIARIKGFDLDKFTFNDSGSIILKKILFSSNIAIVEKLAARIKSLLSVDETVPLFISPVLKNLDLEPKKGKKEEKTTPFPKLFLKELEIKKLKGLSNVKLDFTLQKPLVALMGLNGVGKSTIIHAIACMYKPYEKGEDYKFSYFFPPNPDASWNDSEFVATNFDDFSKDEKSTKYRKNKDRWQPRYSNCPTRDIFYLGINTCVPEIELEKSLNIKYKTEKNLGKHSDVILRKAAYILQKSYDEITLNTTTKNKKLVGVHTKENLTYSSLSMGAGEQRVFKMLEVVYNANSYSLILIDEIDLLLHVAALRRLVSCLSEVAKDKKLQIIFTTHSPEIQELQKYVDIKYLKKTKECFLIYDSLNYDLLFDLSEKEAKPIRLFVEDKFAKVVVDSIVSSCNARRLVEVQCFGSIENGFTLASGIVLEGKDIDNRLVILDGDKYSTAEEKIKRIEKSLSGSEGAVHKELVDKCLERINQFVLPIGYNPEEYIHEMICNLDETIHPELSEIIRCAQSIVATSDKHEYVSMMVEKMGNNDADYWRIIQAAEKSERWSEFTAPIKKWIEERIPKLIVT